MNGEGLFVGQSVLNFLPSSIYRPPFNLSPFIYYPPYALSRGERGYNVLFIKQVGMCACTEHNKNEFLVVLLPNEQPVRLDVTLPLTLAVAVELMRLVFCGQCARLGK